MLRTSNPTNSSELKADGSAMIPIDLPWNDLLSIEQYKIIGERVDSKIKNSAILSPEKDALNHLRNVFILFELPPNVRSSDYFFHLMVSLSGLLPLCNKNTKICLEAFHKSFAEIKPRILELAQPRFLDKQQDAEYRLIVETLGKMHHTYAARYKDLGDGKIETTFVANLIENLYEANLILAADRFALILPISWWPNLPHFTTRRKHSEEFYESQFNNIFRSYFPLTLEEYFQKNLSLEERKGFFSTEKGFDFITKFLQGSKLRIKEFIRLLELIYNPYFKQFLASFYTRLSFLETQSNASPESQAFEYFYLARFFYSEMNQQFNEAKAGISESRSSDMRLWMIQTEKIENFEIPLDLTSAISDASFFVPVHQHLTLEQGKKKKNTLFRRYDKAYEEKTLQLARFLLLILTKKEIVQSEITSVLKSEDRIELRAKPTFEAAVYFLVEHSTSGVYGSVIRVQAENYVQSLFRLAERKPSTSETFVAQQLLQKMNVVASDETQKSCLKRLQEKATDKTLEKVLKNLKSKRTSLSEVYLILVDNLERVLKLNSEDLNIVIDAFRENFLLMFELSKSTAVNQNDLCHYRPLNNIFITLQETKPDNISAYSWHADRIQEIHSFLSLAPKATEFLKCQFKAYSSFITLPQACSNSFPSQFPEIYPLLEYLENNSEKIQKTKSGIQTGHRKKLSAKNSSQSLSILPAFLESDENDEAEIEDSSSVYRELILISEWFIGVTNKNSLEEGPFKAENFSDLEKTEFKSGTFVHAMLSLLTHAKALKNPKEFYSLLLWNLAALDKKDMPGSQAGIAAILSHIKWQHIADCCPSSAEKALSNGYFIGSLDIANEKTAGGFKTLLLKYLQTASKNTNPKMNAIEQEMWTLFSQSRVSLIQEAVRDFFDHRSALTGSVNPVRAYEETQYNRRNRL